MTTVATVTAGAGADTVVNQNFEAVSAAGIYGRRAPGTSGLTWGYYGGRGFGNTIADGTVALTASTTNYVVARRSTGAVSVATSTTNWNDATNYYRVRLIVTGSASVTSDTDYREFVSGVSGGGSGDVSGPASSVDNTLPRFNLATGKSIQGSGVLVSDGDEISGFKGAINRQTGTTYTLVAGDTGKIVELANAAAITLTLPNSLAVGFSCTLVQDGAGQVTLAAASGATIKNRQSHLKLAGNGAMASLYVSSNAGTAAAYRFSGDTAA